MAEPIEWGRLTGMSVSAVDDAENWFRSKPDEIRGTLAEIVAMIDATAWRGPPADRFKSAVDDVLVESIGRLEAAFGSAGDLLAEQGDEQRQASARPQPSPKPAAVLDAIGGTDVRG